MSTNENTQNDFDPHAVPLCESCGSSACCRSEGERAATERLADGLDALADEKRLAGGIGPNLWTGEARAVLKYAAAIVRKGEDSA